MVRCSSPGGSLLDNIWSCAPTAESNASPSCHSDRNSTSYGSYQHNYLHEVFADRSLNDTGFGELSPIDDAASVRPKLRTDGGGGDLLTAGKDRRASPGQYSPFGVQLGTGSPGGGEDPRAERAWPPTSFQDWMSSSRRRVGPAAASEMGHLGAVLSELGFQRNWSGSPGSAEQWSEGHVDRQVNSAWNMPKMKQSPVSDAGCRGSPADRHTVGQGRGNSGVPPVFPAEIPKSTVARESPKEAYERLTTEQIRQQYLSRLLAIQFGHAAASSPGGMAPRVPGPFWPSPQHPATLFGCEAAALGNPTFVAGKVPVILGPSGPVAYDISTVSQFGVPQLVPAVRAFRYCGHLSVACTRLDYFV